MSTSTEPNNHNVDQNEIKKFSALASRWWDKNSEFKTLHQINPLRLGYITGHANIRQKAVIDIGCGGGILAESLVNEGAQVTAIDMAEASLEVAKLHAIESGVSIDYQQITAEDMAISHAESFDVVTCLEMLEHVPEPKSIIESCAKLLRPGGKAFFSTLNKHPQAYLFAIVAAEYLLKLLPKGTHQYQKFITPAEIEQWCRESNLTVKHMTGIHYNPLRESYRLGDGVQVNYIVYAEKN